MTSKCHKSLQKTASNSLHFYIFFSRKQFFSVFFTSSFQNVSNPKQAVLDIRPKAESRFYLRTWHRRIYRMHVCVRVHVCLCFRVFHSTAAALVVSDCSCFPSSHPSSFVWLLWISTLSLTLELQSHKICEPVLTLVLISTDIQIVAQMAALLYSIYVMVKGPGCGAAVVL